MEHIYLAGPMAGHSLSEINKWRVEFSAAMPPGVRCHWPTRGISQTGLQYQGTFTDPKLFTARDKFDVSRSSLVVFNFLGAQRASLGSYVELGWADAMGKVVLAAFTPGSENDHPMLRQMAAQCCTSTDELIHTALHFLDMGK